MLLVVELKRLRLFSLRSNSAACSSAVRKPAISLADSTDLRYGAGFGRRGCSRGEEGDPVFAGFFGKLRQASRHLRVSQSCPSFYPGYVSIVRYAQVCSAGKCPLGSAGTAGLWLVRDMKAGKYWKAIFFPSALSCRDFGFFSPVPEH